VQAFAATCRIRGGTADAVASIMRALSILLTLLPLTATAGERTRGIKVDDTDSRTLSADDIERYAATYYPAIRACYFEHGRASPAATGELALKLVVHRSGYVRDVSLDAPGVRGRQLRKLESCVRQQVLAWHFPVRRDFTTAILPFYFLYLDLPNAGPQYSCWNPRGC
jgi:hypothetical protein